MGVLFFSGLIAGTFGSVVGGGAILMIAMYSLAGLPIIQAIGTTHVNGLLLEGVSTTLFARKKLMVWKHTMAFAVMASIGAVFGSNLVVNFDPKYLSYIVAGIMVVLLFLIPRLKGDSSILPGTIKNNKVVFLTSGLVLGLYGGFYGAALSTFAIFLITYLTGWNTLTSAANSHLVSFFVTLISSYIFITNGVVNWVYLVPMAFGVVLGAFIGVNWATRFGSRWVKILLAVVIIASTINLILNPG